MTIPRIVWRFYDAARLENWENASNIFARINAASLRYADATNDEAITPALRTVIWPPLSESYGASEQFQQWNSRWLHRFGREIISSIPRGSIYFGGTDPGRFVISALCESQVTGKPFFTLTQNQLVDAAYLEYLRAMYGRKIKIPTPEDSKKAFEEYTADAARRRVAGQLKPGEDVRVVNGRVQVSGQVSVMQINAILVRIVFENNPDHAFFVEESFPLDWMYPYLTPHGLIFELNTKPRHRLADNEVRKDRDYWKKICDDALGPWLDEKTSPSEVCDFAVKYGSGADLSKYPGDREFAASIQTRKSFSKLRSSLAGLYAWRGQAAADPDERKRMFAAADFAFRQSYAICPQSPEAIYRYVNMLLTQQRKDDAVLVVKSSLRLDPDNPVLRDLLARIEKM